MILFAASSVFSQKLPPDYPRLGKLGKPELEKWARMQPKAKLALFADLFLSESGKLLQEGDFAKAKISIETGLAIAEVLDNPYVLGKFYYFSGIAALELQGNNGYGLAFDWQKKAESYLKNAKDGNSKLLLGRVLGEIAVYKIVGAKKNEDFLVSISYIKSAYSLALETGSEHLRGISYLALGLYFFYLGDRIKSLTFFEQSEPLLTRANDHNALLYVRAFSIRILDQLGLRALLIDQVKRSSNILNFSSSRRKEISYLRAESIVFNSNGDYTEAIKTMRLGQIKAGKIGDLEGVINFQYSIGTTYLWEGFYAEAEKELREVIARLHSTKINYEDLHLLTLIGLASSLEKQGKTAEGKQIFKEIEQRIETVDLSIKFSYFWHLADFLASQSQIEEARTQFDRAQREAIGIQSPALIRHMLFKKVLFDLKTKSITLSEALQKVNELVVETKEDQLNSQNTLLNINYLDEYIHPFRLKTLIQIDTGDFEGALLHTDSYKSRWLISKMAGDSSFGIVKKDWIISDEAKALRKEIFEKSIALELNGDKSAGPELQNLLKIHEEKMNIKRDTASLKGKIDKSELSKEDLGAVASKLGEKAVISYAFTTEGLIVFIVRKDRPIKAIKIDISESALKEKIDKWREEIISRSLSFKKGGRELYELLIRQAEQELEGASELIIIPEGFLWKIPFQALADANGKYLVQKFPVSYVPSLKALQTLQDRKPGSSNRLFSGFANPANSSVKSLPESEKELKAVALSYPSGTYQIREKATETALKNEMGKAGILHLALHGKLNENEPMRSALIMAKDAQNDGNFEIEEIIELTKSPGLVILSACSTSNGQAFSGEGLLSLSWAFLVAGSQSVIGTQWDIDDKATTEQMQIFHEQFSKGSRSAKSLQYSAIRQIEKKGIQNHPFYWAGFVSLGAL